AIHKPLEAFELRVFERPGPAIDITTLQTEWNSLHNDVDALLAHAKTVAETAPVNAADDMVMTDLFGDSMLPPYPSRSVGKRHRSSNHTFDTKEARWARKREHQQFEAAQR
ncbi:hypothetical protein MTR67_043121, partial [Solanum verrucosum]